MYFLSLTIPIIIAVILSTVAKKYSKNLGYIALIAPITSFSFFFSKIGEVISGKTEYLLFEWIPTLGIDLSFRLTPLSLIFSLLITLMGIIVFYYSISYLASTENKKYYYIYLLVFMWAMLGIVNTNNLIMLYVFWEITGITSFLLIGFCHENEKARYGANKALFVTSAGAICMLVSFLMIGDITNTYEIDVILQSGESIRQSDYFVLVALLLLVGAFAKSAQIPFHIWLPSAMEAPTPVTCYLHSATMVKAGIYLIALFTPIMGNTVFWGGLITLIGLLSLLFGVVMALRSDDLKEVWAYHSVSQLGLIVSLLGMGTENAITAAILHTAMHACFKGSLFLMTGIVSHATHTRNISELGGLAKYMPFTAVVGFLGAFSMSGIPPFAGYISKELFLDSSYEMITMGGYSYFNYLIPILATIGSLGTFLCAVSTIFRVFIFKNKAHHAPNSTFTDPQCCEQVNLAPKEAPWGLLIPSLFLASMNIFLPIIISHYLPQLHLSLWHGFTPALWMSVSVWVIGGLIFLKFNSFHNFITRGKLKIGMNKLYNSVLEKLPHVTSKIRNSYMNGNLRYYIGYVLISSFLMIMIPLLYMRLDETISFYNLARIDIIEVSLVIVTMAAPIMICIERKRVNSILLFGICGYGIAVFFVLFSAPDLALTQLLIETTTLVLYILSIKQFPKERSRAYSKKNIWVRASVAICSGVTVFMLVLIANSNKLFSSISSHFIHTSEELTGSKNVVNAILTDYRAINTVGEVIIIMIAALGISILIHIWTDQKGNTRVYSITYGLEYKVPKLVDNNVILMTLAMPLSITVLCVSVFLLISGHDNPGGSLIASNAGVCAALLLYVTYGKKYLMTIPSHISLENTLVVGVGLIILNGVSGMLLGEEFLAQYVLVLDLPVVGMFELASSIVFEIGMYLAVVSSIMMIILNIGKIEE